MPSDRDFAAFGAVVLLGGGSVVAVVALAVYGAFLLGGFQLILFAILVIAICALIIKLLLCGDRCC